MVIYTSCPQEEARKRKTYKKNKNFLKKFEKMLDKGEGIVVL